MFISNVVLVQWSPRNVTHGTLTKFFRSQAEFCYELPDHVEMEAAVLVEPLAVAVHSAKLANMRPGQRVVVFACGTVGLLSCAVAREFGAVSIIAVDINDERLKFAMHTNMLPPISATELPSAKSRVFVRCLKPMLYLYVLHNVPQFPTSLHV